jgi:hypothetical protein
LKKLKVICSFKNSLILHGHVWSHWHAKISRIQKFSS